MKSCLNLFYCFALLLLSVVCSPAPTVNFSSPPFSATDFNVDQTHNFIGLRGSSNTVPIGIYPIKITFLTGSNYFSIDATGIPNNFVLTVSNNIATWQTNSGSGGGSSGTLTNVVYTNAGPSDTYVLNGTSYLKTNSFSGGGGGGGSNLLYNFNTNDFTASLVTNISLSLNVPRTNRNNTFYGTQTFIDILANTLNTSAGAMVGTDLSWGGMGSGDGSGIVNLNATFLTSGTVGTARLGTGAANSGTYLRGDGSWQPVSGGGGLPTLGGNGTNETFWGTTILTNVTSGNGITFDGTTFLLNGVNLNTGVGGSIGGVGSGLVALNASGISSGTVGIAFLPSTVLTNLVPTNALVPSVSGHTGFIPTNSASGSSSTSSMAFGTYGNFVNFTNISTANVLELSVADMNTNGWKDIVTAHQLASADIWTNNGQGTFWSLSQAFALTNGGCVAVATADFNKNGRIDVAAACGSGNYFTILTNNGSGVLTKLGQNVAITAPSYLIAADFNNDTWPDLMVLATGTINIYTNDHFGNMVLSTNFPSFLANSGSYPCVANFNLDSSVDIAFTPASISQIIIMTNNGSGVFNYWETNNTTSVSCPLAAADLNGDGMTDLISEEPSGNVIRTFTNSGTALVAYTTNSLVSGSSGDGIASGDWNNDGRPDFVIASTLLSRLTFWTNSGSLFSISTSNSAASGGISIRPIIPADLNNDGLVDIVNGAASGNTGTWLFRNSPLFYGLIGGDAARLTNGNVTVTSSSSASSWTPGGASLGALNLQNNYQITSVGGSNIYNGFFRTNTGTINTILSPSPAVALATSWTNTYLGRIILTVDGTVTSAVASSVTVTLTNLTTTESHIIAGTSIASASTENWSFPYEMGTNEIVQFVTTITGSGSAAISKSTVRIH